MIQIVKGKKNAFETLQETRGIGGRGQKGGEIGEERGGTLEKKQYFLETRMRFVGKEEKVKERMNRGKTKKIQCQ